MTDKTYVGSSFENFLEEEGRLDEATEIAIKRVLSWQIQDSMRENAITKTAMAQKMNTNLAAVNQLLDPANLSVNLGTLLKAARALGKKLEINLV